MADEPKPVLQAFAWVLIVAGGLWICIAVLSAVSIGGPMLVNSVLSGFDTLAMVLALTALAAAPGAAMLLGGLALRKATRPATPDA